ncbi:hypothetical protein [Pseudomonas sp. Irchel s3h17]|uniref:hypothetical protein n=1 Tax=Pseudomonas sp. Irchel s3h17 TaxID=2009182 RepID=UPI001179F079|nr:hypothetical protein [Pseudomonas sp. Irchel s3h17]
MKRGSVRLGTLDYYRKTEIEEIRDEGEGQLTFDLIIDSPIELETRWFNTFQPFVRVGFGAETDPVRFPGKTSGSIDNLSIKNKTSTQTTMLIERAKIHIEREAPNSLILCVSLANKLDDCRDIFPKYDDQWHIRQTSAQEFGMQLAKALGNKLKEPKRGGLIDPTVAAEELTVHFRHEAVTYTNREAHFNKETTININYLISRMDMMAFIKPISFKREKEYRFILFVVHKVSKTILPLLEDHVILNLPEECLRMTF